MLQIITGSYAALELLKKRISGYACDKFIPGEMQLFFRGIHAMGGPPDI